MLVIKNRILKTVLRYAVPFLLVPLFALLGAVVFDEKKHLFTAFFIAVLSVLLFITGFEKKNIGVRRAVVCSIMLALSVAGRFIPFFKPITALTVITAIYLGAESGFAVGSLSALLSDFYFGLGPWTPFQMLAWGLIGFFAWVFAPLLKKSRVLLLSYGIICGIAFSFIMDVWTVLWYNDTFDSTLYLSAIITAIPYTALYSISNFIFLFFLSKPIGQKLERIKIKYGI